MTVVQFPKKPDDKEPMDDIDICTVTIDGQGRVFVWRHDYIETREQYNWLIAKLGEATSALIADKDENT